MYLFLFIFWFLKPLLAYKIAAPSELIDEIEPILKFVDREVQLLAYDTKPLWRIRHEICNCLALGASSIILPEQYEGHVAAAAIVQSISNATNVPCISLHLPPPTRPHTHLHPHLNARAMAVAAFIKRERWRDVVVVFEDPNELLEVTDMITAGHFDPFSFSSQLVRLKHGDDFGVELKHIKNKLDRYRIVINLPLLKSLNFLEQAANMSMCGVLYHYIVMHMDLVTLNLEDPTLKRIEDCNITTIALNDIHSPRIQRLRRDLIAARLVDLPFHGMLSQTALWLDTLYVLVEAIRGGVEGDATTPKRCDASWADGNEVRRRFFETRINAISGDVYWSPSGERANYSLHIYRRKNTLRKFAEWNSRTRQITSAEAVVVANNSQKLTLEGKHLKVTVYLEAPFVMVTENGSYDGYCIDLLHKIAGIMKFTYTIHKVRDNAYGSKEANGKWNGMVGELQRGDADLAVASLTISYSRSEVIDFTVPYMHLGISILFKKPRITDSDWFKFMDPLSYEVWLLTFGSYCIVSIALWIISKISPYEQFCRNSDTGHYEPVDNQFSIRNSFWFTVCSLMQQGSELCPRAVSTRFLTAIWWFFALILISSYTANLAAVMTTRRMETPIENADDLAAQTKIKYGTLGRGSTMSFFNESKIETYERMWQLMSSQPGLFVASSKEGIARVKSSDYAYLMESSMLEYAVERDCELMQIGGLLDQKGYGIGLPKGSPYRELISTAILRLQEKTELTELKEKWWKDKSIVCEQPKRKDQDDGESIGGIFIILVVGLVFTTVLIIWELLSTRRSLQTQAPNESDVPMPIFQINPCPFE